MISSLNHRLHHSACKSPDFFDAILGVKKEEDVNTVRDQAQILFAYLNRTLYNVEKKTPSSEPPTTPLIKTPKPVHIDHITTQSTSFPKLLDFWKFMIKIFLSTIILLILTYLIIRTLLWVIETTFKSNGDSSRGISGGLFLVGLSNDQFL